MLATLSFTSPSIMKSYHIFTKYAISIAYNAIFIVKCLFFIAFYFKPKESYKAASVIGKTSRFVFLCKVMETVVHKW